MRPSNYVEMHQHNAQRHRSSQLSSPYSRDYRGVYYNQNYVRPQTPTQQQNCYQRPVTPNPGGYHSHHHLQQQQHHGQGHEYYNYYPQYDRNVYRRDNRPQAQPTVVDNPSSGDSQPATKNEQIRHLFIKRNIDLSQSESLGSGKYSKVFTAEQISSSNPNKRTKMAMKIINTKKVTSEFSKKFLPREIDCWKRLQHPHLVRLLGHYTAFDYVFLTMEFGERGDMLGYVQKHGAVSESQCRTWMKQIMSGVSYMHQKAIAHRDLKLENIVLFSDNSVKVADFGFARPVDRSPSHTFCGSKSYSAPEILLGKPYNPYKSDVWSLGIVAFILVTDRMPFVENQKNHKIVELQRNHQYAYPQRIQLGEHVRFSIETMLTFNPKERPSVYDCFSLPWFYSSKEPRTTQL